MSVLKVPGLTGYYQCSTCGMRTADKRDQCGKCGSTVFHETYVPEEQNTNEQAEIDLA